MQLRLTGNALYHQREVRPNVLRNHPVLVKLLPEAFASVSIHLRALHP